MDPYLSTLCVWLVFGAGAILIIIGVAYAAIATALNLVKKVQFVRPSDRFVEGIVEGTYIPPPNALPPPPPPRHTPPHFDERAPRCVCGVPLSDILRSENNGKGNVLVYQCTCGKITKV